MESLENQPFGWLGDVHELSWTSPACGKDSMGHFMTLKEFCWKFTELWVFTKTENFPDRIFVAKQPLISHNNKKKLAILQNPNSGARHKQ